MVDTVYTDGSYLLKNPTWHVDESPWKTRAILRMMSKHGLTPKSICEVGCGAGEILHLLQRQLTSECEFWGYDISPQAIELSRQRANEKLHFQLADFIQEKDVQFDLLLVMDVIEHLEDYFSFLRKIHPASPYKILQLPLDISVRTVLRGLLISYRRQYGHLHYFTKEVALQMIRDAGYEVVDYFYVYTGVRISFSWNEVKKNPRILPRKLLGALLRALIRLPGALFFALHKDAAARIIGDWRLLILAR